MEKGGDSEGDKRPLTADDLMPKTYSMEELIPGYAEMEAENKLKAAEKAKAEKERELKGGAEQPELVGKVPEQDLEAFKEAFEKARKKKGGNRRTSLERSQELKLRRGVVVDRADSNGIFAASIQGSEEAHRGACAIVGIRSDEHGSGGFILYIELARYGAVDQVGDALIFSPGGPDDEVIIAVPIEVSVACHGRTDGVI